MFFIFQIFNINCFPLSQEMLQSTCLSYSIVFHCMATHNVLPFHSELSVHCLNKITGSFVIFS